jgi:hypothetical protein
VKYRLPSVVFRSLLGVLLLASVGSCSLYHKVHHPYRLPTPKPSPEYIAQQKKKKEDEKLRNDLAKASASARKKSGGGTEEAATDVSMPSADAAAAAPSEARGTLPEKSTVRYDKQELMKKPKLMRRRRHKHRKGFHPIESIRNFFKYGLHAKPNYSPDHRPAPKEPKAAPDEATPDSEPAPTGKP